MKYGKAKDGSYVHNCYIEMRDGMKEKIPFHGTCDHVSAFLNGFAIIPIEDYAELTGKNFAETLEKIKQADIDLHSEQHNSIGEDE